MDSFAPKTSSESNLPDFLFSVQTQDFDRATRRDLLLRVLKNDSGAFFCSEFFRLFAFFPASAVFRPTASLPSFKSGDKFCWLFRPFHLGAGEASGILKFLDSHRYWGTLNSEQVLTITSFPSTLATFVPFLISPEDEYKRFWSHRSDLFKTFDSFFRT